MLGAAADTLTDFVALPPEPVQVSVYDVVEPGATLVLPPVPIVPDQPPEATQPVAPLDDQLSDELCPALMLVGLAVRETVGMGAVTATDTFTKLAGAVDADGTVTDADFVIVVPYPAQVKV